MEDIIMENRELATINTQSKWSDKQIETIKKTVAVGASNEELDMFLTLASTYDLNPFLKEIWCIKMGNRVVITTSRDGYLRIANRDKHFRGLVSDAIYSNDKFAKTKDGVEHTYTGNRGQIIGAYALVYRDDRDYPTYFFAPFKDYYKKGGTWDQYPHAMIVKVAESMALKRAFAISGLVTQEEIGDGNTEKIEAQVAKSAPQPAEQKQQQPLTPEERERKIQLNQLYQRYMAVCDNQKQHVFNVMKKITGKNNSADFTHEDILALFEDVIKREDEQMMSEISFAPSDEVIEAEPVDNTENSNVA